MTGPPAQERHADARLALALGVVAAGLALVLALGPLQGIAHVSDEVAYTLQARLFAAGMRVGPPADEPSMWLYPFWQAGPESFAVFPPGWPALLAAGEVVGAPWAVNALLAGLLPGLTLLLSRAWGRPADEARLAATVAALSPGVVLLAGSRMSHTSVLVALLAALVVVERRRDPPWAWLLGGLGLAYVVLARPFDAALLAAPLWALGLWRLRGSSVALRPPFGTVLVWTLPAVLSAGLLLVDNLARTGDAFTFAVGPWFDAWVADMGRGPGCNALGFGADRGCHPTYGSWGHDPDKALRFASETLVLLDRFLLGLPGGLLLAVVGGLRLRRALPLVAAVLVVVGYALYWSPGNVFGARFWHPLYAVLPVLVAAGLSALPGALRAWLPPFLLAGACLVGLGRAAVELAPGYWCVNGTLPRMMAAQGVDQGLLFVAGGGSRQDGWPWLGRPEFRCDPMLATGAAFQLADPSRSTGGLQVRHALSSMAELQAFRARYHPQAPAWLATYDLPADAWRLQRLPEPPPDPAAPAP